MREIKSTDELKSLIGHDVGVSDWISITQDRINQFAEVTNDRQWIHVDVERCRQESPYGTTIAHGFFTLSLLPLMMQQAFTVDGMALTLNYGVNKVRFPAPVLSDSKVQGVFVLLAVDDAGGKLQMTWQCTINSEHGTKPVCVAEMITRRYP